MKLSEATEYLGKEDWKRFLEKYGDKDITFIQDDITYYRDFYIKMFKKELMKIEYEKKPLEKITIWYLVSNGGDGSAYPICYLTKEETETVDEADCEGFAETCNGEIETYKGSNVHLEAIFNSEELLEGI